VLFSATATLDPGSTANAIIAISALATLTRQVIFNTPRERCVFIRAERGRGPFT
jgi:hypothetical protein